MGPDSKRLIDARKEWAEIGSDDGGHDDNVNDQLPAQQPPPVIQFDQDDNHNRGDNDGQDDDNYQDDKDDQNDKDDQSSNQSIINRQILVAKAHFPTWPPQFRAGKRKLPTPEQKKLMDRPEYQFPYGRVFPTRTKSSRSITRNRLVVRSSSNLPMVTTEDCASKTTATTLLGELSGRSEAKRGRYDNETEEIASVCGQNPEVREQVLALVRRLNKEQDGEDDGGSMA